MNLIRMKEWGASRGVLCLVHRRNNIFLSPDARHQDVSFYETNSFECSSSLTKPIRSIFFLFQNCFWQTCLILEKQKYSCCSLWYHCYCLPSIQKNGIDDFGGHWLSCFSKSLTLLQVLNCASLNTDFSFEPLKHLFLINIFKGFKSPNANFHNLHS